MKAHWEQLAAVDFTTVEVWTAFGILKQLDFWAFFAGSIDMIHLRDMVALADQFAAASNSRVRFAPKDGNEALGIEQGFELKGELFALNKQMAKVDAVIATGDGQPTIDIKGNIHPFDFEVIKLSRGDVDIYVGPVTNPHFKINADATVGLKQVILNADIDNRKATCYFSEKVRGVYQIEFETTASTVGSLSWQMEATFTNKLGQTLKEDVNRQLDEWAKETQRAFDKAQADLERGKKREREKLVRHLEQMLLEADQELATHMKDVIEFQAKVDAQNAALDRWDEVVEISYAKYQAAKRKRRNESNPFKKTTLRVPENALGAAWRSAQADAVVAKPAIREVLKQFQASVSFYKAEAAKHGIDKNPKVISARAALESFDAGTTVATAVLDGNEQIALGGLEAGKWMATHAGELIGVVEQVKISGSLSQYASGTKVRVDVMLRLKGEPKVITLQASAEDIENNRIATMLFEDIKRLL